MKRNVFLLCGLAAMVALAAIPAPFSPTHTDETLADRPLLPSIPYPYEDFFQNLQPHMFFDSSILGSEYNPVDNSISDEGATLGRVLFFDKRLSQNFTISCASCHEQEDGFSDPNQFSEGFNGGHTHRNSMGLVNARFQPTGSFFWDASADTLRTQVKMALTSSVEMGMEIDTIVARLNQTDFYPQLFSAAFGDPNITFERTVAAIGQFVRSMVSSWSKYDKGMAMVWDHNVPFPNFTNEENLGKSLFFDSNNRCGHCHFSQNFHLGVPVNNGLDLVYADSGFGGFTQNPFDNGKFKAASLRNIALTAPYMHDGRFTTLQAVINHYDSGVQAHPNLDPQLKDIQGNPRQLNLTQTEKNALVAFLKTLTDSVFITDPRFENPFELDSVRTYTPQTPGFPFNVDDPFEAKLKTFPNPFVDQLKVELENPRSQMVQLRLFSAQGQLVAQGQTRSRSFTFPRERLAPGNYVLEVNMGPDRWVRKVVAE